MNALVVGKGRMGSFHAKVLRDLGYTVRTVDPDPSKDADYPTIAEAVLSRNRSFPHDALARFDVAAIATPAEYLVDSAYQLAGVPMLVEKPFALTSRSAWMLAAYLKQAGKPVCVGYVERFNPQVRELLPWQPSRIEHAQFDRLSDRPSWNASLDLLSHDIDLALELGIPFDRCSFYTRADQPEKLRRITLTSKNEPPLPNVPRVIDLMGHDLSPLHALWHAFLTGKPVPTPEEAARVLEVIESMNGTREEMAA